MGFEATPFKLTDGVTLYEVAPDCGCGECGTQHGLFQLQADGTARIWRRVWVDEFVPDSIVFPGPISAMRAILRREV